MSKLKSPVVVKAKAAKGENSIHVSNSVDIIGQDAIKMKETVQKVRRTNRGRHFKAQQSGEQKDQTRSSSKLLLRADLPQTMLADRSQAQITSK